MKQQLDEIKKDKDIKLSKGTSNVALNSNVEKLKQELGIKNNRIFKEDIKSNIKNDDDKIKYNNKEEAILFDKLKLNYSNNKKLIIELLKENELIKKKINDSKSRIKKKNYLYLLYEQKKESSFNIISKERKKELGNNNYKNNNIIILEKKLTLLVIILKIL